MKLKQRVKDIMKEEKNKLINLTIKRGVLDQVEKHDNALSYLKVADKFEQDSMF